MRSRILILSVTLVFTGILQGCGTPYQRESLTGGYSDYRLQEGVYRITFRGNAFIELEAAQDLALLRAAEVAIENGYRYFTVVEGGARVEDYSFTTPVSATTQGVVGPYGTYQGYTQLHGGQTYTFEKPRVGMVINCFRDKPAEGIHMVYDAPQIAQGLHARYGGRSRGLSSTTTGGSEWTAVEALTKTPPPRPANLTDEERKMWDSIYSAEHPKEITQEEYRFLRRVMNKAN